MTRETRVAGDLQVGDKVYAPGSRHPREITQLIEADHQDGYRRVYLEGAEWLVPSTMDVEVETSEVAPANEPDAPPPLVAERDESVVYPGDQS